MTERERLIELINKAKDTHPTAPIINGFRQDLAEYLADHLLSNGVIVPPCKVGDETFLLLEKLKGGYDIVKSRCVSISENFYCKIYSMSFNCPEIDNTLEYKLGDFGRWVFLTKEEAEKALKERSEGE